MATYPLVAPVTGVVWKIQARVGDSLQAGDTVILVESMKMEIPVDMPRAGRISKILVAEEDAVAEGQVLAEFE